MPNEVSKYALTAYIPYAVTATFAEETKNALLLKSNLFRYYLFHDFSLDKELEFYLYLDMLTYLPFEKLGYEYLNNELEKEVKGGSD